MLLPATNTERAKAFLEPSVRLVTVLFFQSLATLPSYPALYTSPPTTNTERASACLEPSVSSYSSLPFFHTLATKFAALWSQPATKMSISLGSSGGSGGSGGLDGVSGELGELGLQAVKPIANIAAATATIKNAFFIINAIFK